MLQRPQYQRLQVGVIQDEKPSIYGAQVPGQLSLVPYAEPTWLAQGFKSPYYNDVCSPCSSFSSIHISFLYTTEPSSVTEGRPPFRRRDHLPRRPGKRGGWQAAKLGCHCKDGRAKHPRYAYGTRKAPERPYTDGWHCEAGRGESASNRLSCIIEAHITQFTYFHELVVQQEIPRVGARGYGDGLNAGAVIGLPPVLNYGNPELRERVSNDVLSGKKFICLAVSEPFAGSDVMGLQTTATKTEDGKHWIINGTKKYALSSIPIDFTLTYGQVDHERHFLRLFHRWL